MSPASYQTAPPRVGILTAIDDDGQHEARENRVTTWFSGSSMCESFFVSMMRRSSSRHDADIALAMMLAELDDLLLLFAGARLALGEHQLARVGGFDIVSLDA